MEEIALRSSTAHSDRRSRAHDLDGIVDCLLVAGLCMGSESSDCWGREVHAMHAWRRVERMEKA